MPSATAINRLMSDYLDEVIVSGSRVEQQLQDVAAVATTISSDQIEKMLVDIKDMLRYETGVSVRSQPNRASTVFRATG